MRKSKVLKIPIRIWGGVDGSFSLSSSARVRSNSTVDFVRSLLLPTAITTKQGYDLMQPVIQRKEEAELEELDPQLAKKLVTVEELEKEEHDRTRQFFSLGSLSPSSVF